jgi:N-acetylglucosamine malate deacetylase 1
VIAVGAHPDDAEIACGGTLAALARQGYQVGIIDLTDGEPTPFSTGPEVRLAEAEQAARTLGVHTRVTLDLPNRRLFDSFEARVMLAKQFRRYRPSVVISFGDKTPTASPDHWQAMQITDAAVFYSRLSKWEEHFDGLPVHTIAAQSISGWPSSPRCWAGTITISPSISPRLWRPSCKPSAAIRVSSHPLGNTSSSGSGARR